MRNSKGQKFKNPAAKELGRLGGYWLADSSRPVQKDNYLQNSKSSEAGAQFDEAECRDAYAERMPSKCEALAN